MLPDVLVGKLPLGIRRRRRSQVNGVNQSATPLFEAGASIPLPRSSSSSQAARGSTTTSRTGISIYSLVNDTWAQIGTSPTIPSVLGRRGPRLRSLRRRSSPDRRPELVHLPQRQLDPLAHRFDGEGLFSRWPGVRCGRRLRPPLLWPDLEVRGGKLDRTGPVPIGRVAVRRERGHGLRLHRSLRGPVRGGLFEPDMDLERGKLDESDFPVVACAFVPHRGRDGGRPDRWVSRPVRWGKRHPAVQLPERHVDVLRREMVQPFRRPCAVPSRGSFHGVRCAGRIRPALRRC